MTSLRGHTRREFSQAIRKAAFRRCCRDGIPYCEGCGNQVRGTPIYEHDQADGLGGEPTAENCKVHCKNCADVKTHKDDNPRMRKADRVLKHTYGLEPVKRKIANRGFAKAEPQRTATRPIAKWSPSTGGN
jgi:hypothetical protein